MNFADNGVARHASQFRSDLAGTQSIGPEFLKKIDTFSSPAHIESILQVILYTDDNALLSGTAILRPLKVNGLKPFGVCRTRCRISLSEPYNIAYVISKRVALRWSSDRHFSPELLRDSGAAVDILKPSLH